MITKYDITFNKKHIFLTIINIIGYNLLSFQPEGVKG